MKTLNRKSIRLKGYDYSKPGYYFLTICTEDKKCIFGKINNGEMILNEFGKIVENEWKKTKEIRSDIEIDDYVIMPNHFHAIIIINDTVGAIHELPVPTEELPLPMTTRQRRNMTLPKIIGRFKMLTAKQINEIRKTSGIKFWQRNYYEHIIRNDEELKNIREYIQNNPLKWELDKYYYGKN